MIKIAALELAFHDVGELSHAPQPATPSACLYPVSRVIRLGGEVATGLMFLIRLSPAGVFMSFNL
jgi:hypothetical protein